MIAPTRKKPRFAPGDLVYHKRYHYRGVIVAADPECRAGDAWYQKNQTKPHRNQPWYHVLVDGAAHTTYVAQSNLEPDALGEPVQHPLLEHFFSGFDGRRYERNDREWEV